MGCGASRTKMVDRDLKVPADLPMSRSMHTMKPAAKPSRRTYTAAEDRLLARLRSADGWLDYTALDMNEKRAARDLTKRGLAAVEAGPFAGVRLA